MFSSDQSEWWKEFVESFDAKYGTTTESATWPETLLIPGGDASLPTVQLPSKIVQLRQAETTEYPKVFYLFSAHQSTM